MTSKPTDEEYFQAWLTDNFPEIISYGDGDMFFLSMRSSFFAGYTLAKIKDNPKSYGLEL